MQQHAPTTTAIPYNCAGICRFTNQKSATTNTDRTRTTLKYSYSQLLMFCCGKVANEIQLEVSAYGKKRNQPKRKRRVELKCIKAIESRIRQSAPRDNAAAAGDDDRCDHQPRQAMAKHVPYTKTQKRTVASVVHTHTSTEMTKKEMLWQPVIQASVHIQPD